MPTKNIVLTPYQSSYVEGLVASGRYQNASEVLREGLRLVEQRENDEQARLQALRLAAAVGEADMAAGRYLAFASAEQLGLHLQSLSTQAIAR